MPDRWVAESIKLNFAARKCRQHTRCITMGSQLVPPFDDVDNGFIVTAAAN